MSLESFLDAVADRTPAPGGGAAAAAGCALGAALAEMAARFAGLDARRSARGGAAGRGARARRGRPDRLCARARRACGCRADDPERPERLRAASSAAAEVPLAIAEAAGAVAELARAAGGRRAAGAARRRARGRRPRRRRRPGGGAAGGDQRRRGDRRPAARPGAARRSSGQLADLGVNRSALRADEGDVTIGTDDRSLPLVAAVAALAVVPGAVMEWAKAEPTGAGPGSTSRSWPLPRSPRPSPRSC